MREIALYNFYGLIPPLPLLLSLYTKKEGEARPASLPGAPAWVWVYPSATQSQTKLKRPGFLPSCKNPKHGSNPVAMIARASRAVTIAVAKFSIACIGCIALRAVN